VLLEKNSVQKVRV